MPTHLSLNQTLIKVKSCARREEVTEAQKVYQLVLQQFPNNIRAKQTLDALYKFNQNNA
jgi:hypothetical protein